MFYLRNITARANNFKYSFRQFSSTALPKVRKILQWNKRILVSLHINLLTIMFWSNLHFIVIYLYD